MLHIKVNRRSIELDEEIRRLMQREHRYCSFCPQSRYVRHRVVLLDWMAQVQAEFRLSQQTLSLAVNYLDRVLADFSICKSQWQLVAMVSIQLAAKFNERETIVPSIAELMACADDAYSRNDVLYMECKIASALSYELAAVTPLQFIEIFAQRGLLLGDKGQNLSADIAKQLNARLLGFVLLSQRDYSFKEFRPSLLASSIAAAARTVVGLEPLWSISHECRVFDTQEQVADCAKLLLARFKAANGWRDDSMTSSRTTDTDQQSPISLVDHHHHHHHHHHHRVTSSVVALTPMTIDV